MGLFLKHTSLWTVAANKTTMNDNGKTTRFVNDPIANRLSAPEKKLVRPAISYTRAGASALLFVIACFFVTYAVTVALQKSLWVSFEAFMQCFFVVCLISFAFCLKFMLVWFIRLYQRYAKSETRLRCCFIPSCSEYAILAIKKYGAIIGTIKTISRLRRCRPPGGEDYP